MEISHTRPSDLSWIESEMVASQWAIRATLSLAVKCTRDLDLCPRPGRACRLVVGSLLRAVLRKRAETLNRSVAGRSRQPSRPSVRNKIGQLRLSISRPGL
ncbi:Hypothetical predicted protein [Olea europaea subsp. europaea]|uniref:Uncharacterized protein n=1 Tax=Olea europaea subsp. europaea TaxID=158383 RepID=A0A8S0TKD8_OLEEU|nr:Hypothetical predicted protein [Olea europaea subsp. europaea]